MYHNSPEDKKKIKISLKSNQPNKNDDNLEYDLIKRAINKSYIKQLARSDEDLPVQDTMGVVGNFLLGFLPIQDIRKQLEEYWCIVALNQDALFGASQGFSLCSTPISSSIRMDQLKLYQLFIGLGYRQFRLQSLSEPDKYFFFNADTIESAFIFTDVNEPHSQNRIRVMIDNKNQLDFFITPATLPFQFTLLNPVEQTQKMCLEIANGTLKIIKNSISQSKGKLYKLPSKLLPDKEDYYHNRYVSQQQFAKYCQTGDVILFRDNHTFAKVQRFLTNSECDHIGMVYRDQKYGLCIFQSNSGTGVSLAMWNQLIRYKWFENIEGIYWRRLNMQNKAQNFEARVKEFVKVNLHKQYGFSLGKLLTSQQIVYNEEEEKKRTYFCSQLIAALYKQLGLLESEKPSSSYIPKDFTDKGSMNMINNTALQAQRRLVFNQNLLKENYRFYK